MSGPFGSSQFMYATGAEEGQSLRFEDGDSAYMTHTPTTAGNRRTWTFSTWIKRGNITSNQGIFGAESSGDRLVLGFGFSGSDQIRFYCQSPSTEIYTTSVLRDPSAWYNIVWAVDTTQATSTDRIKIYVNGEQITSFASASYPAQNSDYSVNNTVTQYIGRWAGYAGEYLDGYLANVCLIDGQALTPTSFGEYDDTLWKPKSDTDIQALTFGTNGFYLPFKQTTEAEGFSTVTYSGNGGTQSIEGVGFEPDLVWMKERTNINSNQLIDSVRGVQKGLFSDLTIAEYTYTNHLSSFNSSGFTLGLNPNVNGSGKNYVAWCWDAGSGSAVSNTDGSITSTVKANTAKGFSIVSWIDNASTSSTVGHGLNSAPELIITKNRDGAFNWFTWTTVIDGSYDYLSLNRTDSKTDDSTRALPTSSVFTNVGSTSGNKQIAYCFHSVSGYSSIGSYTGTGSAGNSITGLGFKPAWVMVKRTDNTSGWSIYDNTRTPINPRNLTLSSNLSNAEVTSTSNVIDFDNDGFTLLGTGTTTNASGGAYIYMAFADTRDATFFGDTSGNSNNWTPNALNNTDVLPDSPVTGGNFATLNTIDKHASAAISEGNLEIGTNTNAWYHQARATMFVNSGKWYWEVHQVGTGSFWKIGIRDNDAALTSNTTSSTGYEYYAYDGNKHSSSGASAYSSETGSQGNVYGFALDMDAGTITLYVNGVSQGTMFSGLSGYYAPTCSMYNSTIMFNFGQDSSFAGNATPQGNTDDNGVGDFYYAPPSGFLALTTGNLPAATITAPDDYFNTVLYTGNNADRNIDVGFQSDFVWIKERNGTPAHRLYDIVRGDGQTLFSNLTNAEYDGASDGIDFSYSNGFAIDAGSNVGSYNGTSDTYVAWNWLAGGTGVSNTDGSITSTVSANQTAGFSIVSYVGNGSSSQTVGHGLGSVSDPSLLIVKNRDQTDNWIVRMNVNGTNKFLFLDSTSSGGTSSVSLPTTDVFGVGTSGYDNTSGENYIAYLFSSVSGYSKIGSYTGNGSTDGTFVHCGFRPAFVMVKRTDSISSWYILDNKRNGFNPDNTELSPESSASEADFDRFDFTSNGFKIRQSYSGTNASGGSFIFLAFAEAPFKSANAR